MNVCDVFEPFTKYKVDEDFLMGYGVKDKGYPYGACRNTGFCSIKEDLPLPPCPDGLRNYRPHLATDTLPVGIGCLSQQETTSVSYIFRAAPGTPFARPRSCRPGEVGWGIPELTDWEASQTGQQIVLGDMRQHAEDRSTHELMGAWYPPPNEQTPMGSDGFYKENIYSGRPGTANVRYMGGSTGPSQSRDGHCTPSSPVKSSVGCRACPSPRRCYSPHRPGSVRFTNERGDGVWTNPSC